MKKIQRTLILVAASLGMPVIGAAIFTIGILLFSIPTSAHEVAPPPQDEAARRIVEDCFKYNDFIVEFPTPDGVKQVKFICMPILEGKLDEGKKYEL